MTKSIILTALTCLAFSGATFAKDNLVTKAGTLQAVDFGSYTLSIADEQGNVESYSFTAKTRTIINGRAVNLRRALVPGQEVEIKIRAEKLEQAAL